MRRYFGASLAEPGPEWEESHTPVPPTSGGPCSWPENGGPFHWTTHGDAYELGIECICPSRFNGDCNEPVDPFFFADEQNIAYEKMAPANTTSAFEAAGLSIGKEEEAKLARTGAWEPPVTWGWKEWLAVGAVVAGIGIGIGTIIK